jgi:hypothetical protein
VLRAVAGLHGVDETGLLVVAQISQRRYIEGRHHLVVLVDQIVAVEHVEAVPWCVASDNVDLFVGVQPDNILECNLFIRQDTTTRAASACDDLEVDQMDMNGVGPSTSAVLKNPVLDRSTLRFGEHTLFGTISPGDTVDLPFATCTLELELVFDCGVGGREWHIAELGREVVVLVVVGYCTSDDELHNLVGVQVIGVIGDLLVAPQCYVAVFVGAEVNDDLPPFSHGDIELSRVDRVEKKTSVGSNDLEIDSSANLGRLFEVQLERAADRGIQEAESILAWFDLKVRPGLTVDMDNIAEEVGSLAVRFRAPQRAVRVVTLRGQSEWNIVVSLRQASDSLLLVIMKDVESSLTHIGVLSGVVDSVVVIPERTCVLTVGIVVILVGVGLGGVLGPAVKRRPRCKKSLGFEYPNKVGKHQLTIRAMKMDRVCTIGVVDEAYDRLCSLAHHEGRTRCHAIITNQSGGTKVRVHLLGERLDVNLIIVDRWTIGESKLP